MKNQVKFILNEEPSFDRPVSQLATESQFSHPNFNRWVTELKERNWLHRKLWEYSYVVQVLFNHKMLEKGRKGIGFGVGTEPLPALFAKYGCKILASDQDFKNAAEQGWVVTTQYATNKNNLNSRGICDPKQFEELVELTSIDMNKIPKDVNDFDFTWSCCSLEHLGNIDAGLDFIKNSLNCLKPGGIAVHTTEYNVSSQSDTVESGATVIYRSQDIAKLALEAAKNGHEVYPINLHVGTLPGDQHIDLPPYKQEVHLKLLLMKYVSTSIGIIIRKA